MYMCVCVCVLCISILCPAPPATSTVRKNMLVVLDDTATAKWQQYQLFLQEMVLTLDPPIGVGASSCRVAYQDSQGMQTVFDTATLPYVTNELLINQISGVSISSTYGTGNVHEALTYASNYFASVNATNGTLSSSPGSSHFGAGTDLGQGSSSVNYTSSKSVLVLFNGNSQINESEVSAASAMKQNGTVIYAIGTSTATQLEQFKVLATTPATSYAVYQGEDGDVTQLASLIQPEIKGGEVQY